MKFAFILTVLFIACSTLLSAEASVLPAGTVIAIPKGASTTLSETSFLLTRQDLEAATLALEERDLLREELKQKKLGAIFIPIGSGLLGILLGFFISRLAQ